MFGVSCDSLSHTGTPRLECGQERVWGSGFDLSARADLGMDIMPFSSQLFNFLFLNRLLAFFPNELSTLLGGCISDLYPNFRMTLTFSEK